MKIRNIHSILIILLGALRTLAQVDIVNHKESTQFDVQIEGLVLKSIVIEGKEFLSTRLKGIEDYQGIFYDVGKPEIPVFRTYLDGVKQVKVEVDSSSEIIVEARHSLKPSLSGSAKVPGMRRSLAIQQRAYQETSQWALGSYEVSEAGSMDGVQRQLLTIYPLVYDPPAGKITMVTRFRITSLRVDNIQQKPGANLIAFVAGKKFAQSQSVRAYRDFKESLGFSTVLLIVGTEMDDAKSIRAKLSDLYASSGLKHVLLIGDNADVPGASSNHISGVTDHYYRCLDQQDYEKDINGPDIGVGRISAENETMLASMLAKQMRYEQGAFSSRQWLRGITYVASDDPNFYQVIEGTDNYVIDTYTKPMGYLGSFPSIVEAGGDKLYAIAHKATGWDALARIQQGRGIINYGGHGNIEIWGSPTVTIPDVLSLKDNGAIPWVIANACYTGNFTGDSIGEVWHQHPHGAVMYLGSMDSSLWDEDDIYQRRMYDGIFKNGYREFSDITAFAASELWKHYGGAGNSKYYWETYVTLGDPSMKLRTWPIQ